MMPAGAARPAVSVKLARTAEERELVYRLRYDTYLAVIPSFSAVADHVTRQLTDEHDKHSELLTAYAGGQLVGTMRLTFGADSPLAASWSRIPRRRPFCCSIYAGCSPPGWPIARCMRNAARIPPLITAPRGRNVQPVQIATASPRRTGSRRP